MPNGVHGPCTADVNPPRTTSGPTSRTYLLFGSVHPSFMLKLTLGAEAGRQGASPPLRLQRCGPAVSRLIQSNLPLSQSGTRILPLILMPRGTANNSTPRQHHTQQAGRGPLC